ncbi:MAG: molybdate ABC transporter permease subunit [Anaerolineales bacterium]|nr:molybdate ABC transporter permease subunit [Anaerolineales bacterium]
MLALPGFALAAFLVIPLLVLILRGITQQFLAYLSDPTLLSAVALSLVTSTLSTFLALAAGTPLAYVLGRVSFPGKSWLELPLDIPVVLPPLIVGIALLLTFGRNGLLGRPLDLLGIRLPFTTAAVVLAATFIAAPLYLRTARIGFAMVPQELREEAIVEGANEWQVFRHVMLPLSWRALLGGLILCWTRALGEFGATIVFAGNMVGRTQTMPLAIFIGFETNLSIALALSVILVAVSVLVLIGLKLVDRAYSTTVG